MKKIVKPLLCQCLHYKNIHDEKLQCRVCDCVYFILYDPSQKSGNDHVVKGKE